MLSSLIVTNCRIGFQDLPWLKSYVHATTSRYRTRDLSLALWCGAMRTFGVISDCL